MSRAPPCVLACCGVQTCHELARLLHGTFLVAHLLLRLLQPAPGILLRSQLAAGEKSRGMLTDALARSSLNRRPG